MKTRQKKRTLDLTSDPIFQALVQFSVPVLATLLLQALYGGVDLLVVGQFASTADVSGVATGSMLLQTVNMVVTGLAMGITVLVGEKIGQKEPEEAGRVIGAGICLFAVISLGMTVLLAVGADSLAGLMQAPSEALAQTAVYIRICGVGIVFIIGYNLLGAIFRGMGDSRTPLVTVSIACVINIAGDLLLVKGFGLGAAGAALATVGAQAISVLLSLLLIWLSPRPFHFTCTMLRFDCKKIGRELQIGIPVALQELLVGTSFLVIQAIVNALGVTASAGVGVAEKVCVFIMLVPSAYAQSMSAFTAQNRGAGKLERARKALIYGIFSSLIIGAFMGVVTFFHGDLLASAFARDPAVIQAAHSYLKAYAIDCFLTPFLFCFVGYFNGCEKTLFVMLQGLAGAFCVRIPVAYWMSIQPGATLFSIGLGTPFSSLVQNILCIAMFAWMQQRTGFQGNELRKKE